MSKQFTCYGFRVTKDENKPINVFKMIMDVEEINGKRFLVSPKGRQVFKVDLKNPNQVHVIEPEREHFVSLGLTSMAGFKIDVIMRTHERSKCNRFYANNRDHLVRFVETCYYDYLENIKTAIQAIEEYKI